MDLEISSICLTMLDVSTPGICSDFTGIRKCAIYQRDGITLTSHRFMFHQANLRMADVPEVPVNGVMKKLSLIAIWTEVVLQEMVRL